MCFNISNGLRGVHLIRKDTVELLEESSVVNHASAIGNFVAGNQFLNFLLVELDVEGTNAGAEGSLSTSALSKLVEIDKELLHTHAILSGEGLQTALNVALSLKGDVRVLERVRVAVIAPAHVLGLVAE